MVTAMMLGKQNLVFFADALFEKAGQQCSVLLATDDFDFLHCSIGPKPTPEIFFSALSAIGKKAVESSWPFVVLTEATSVYCQKPNQTISLDEILHKQKMKMHHIPFHSRNINPSRKIMEQVRQEILDSRFIERDDLFQDVESALEKIRYGGTRQYFEELWVKRREI